MPSLGKAWLAWWLCWVHCVLVDGVHGGCWDGWGLWGVVVGWCRLGYGEGCGVCVEKRVLGLFFFGVPFFAFRRGTVRRLRCGRRRAPHGRAGARVCVSFRIGGGLMGAKPAEGMGGVVCDA